MISKSVRAVYEQGLLRLLDPIELIEGQEIQVTIISNRERARAALGKNAVQDEFYNDPALDEPIDEAALLAELDEATRGIPSVSEAIIEERRESP